MLTDVAIRGIPPVDKPKRFFDGKGLYLEVRPNGSRLWRYKFRHGGSERTLALGPYPEVSLSKARAALMEAREQVRAGVDPVRARKARTATGATFQAVAEEWLAKHGAEFDERTAATARHRLERFVYPRIGQLDVGTIRARDILEVLQPLEARDVLELAHRVRSRIGQVLRYAVATGRADRDVTIDLRGALAAVTVTHHAALTEPAKVGGLMRAIEDYDGGILVRTALKLAALTFVRPGELRHAEWSEFDIERAEWSIPGEKMKMKQPHLVPLATQAVALIEDLRQYTSASTYLFPSPRTLSRPISDAATTSALRRMGYRGEEMTSHGFRAMARTMLDEQLGIPAHLIEHQLAHAVKDPLGRAYNRTSHLPERRAMMQRWADYLDEIRAR